MRKCTPMSSAIVRLDSMSLGDSVSTTDRVTSVRYVRHSFVNLSIASKDSRPKMGFVTSRYCLALGAFRLMDIESTFSHRIFAVGFLFIKSLSPFVFTRILNDGCVCFRYLLVAIRLSKAHVGSPYPQKMIQGDGSVDRRSIEPSLRLSSRSRASNISSSVGSWSSHKEFAEPKPSLIDRMQNVHLHGHWFVMFK